MLHTENRKVCEKGILALIVLLTGLLLTGCQGTKSTHQDITMEAFSDMKTPDFVLDLDVIRQQLRQQVKADSGKTAAPNTIHKYYKAENMLLWVNRSGVDSKADTLLKWLHGADELGMKKSAFHVDEIERDMKRLRTLDFDTQNSINTVAARLEYNLTKAFVRYAAGQRFGFTDPYKMLNQMDVEKKDTVTGNVLKYRELFDLPMERVSVSYYESLLSKIRNDSVDVCLNDVQPKGKYYQQMKEMLSKATGEDRKRILCNMERGRWRQRRPIPEDGKRIVVNIPAFHLYAYGTDSLLDMKVVCGNAKTKTPQLTSNIEWMEVNPQWVIPMSIIETDVAKRAGDTVYFSRNRYHIFDRQTNKELAVTEVSKAMLLSGKYRVAQEGGAGNSLGRIIFRFKNNFSVFLHDTSNPGAFERSQRSMSHGCVRVAKPFNLCQFVLGENADEWLLDRIRISMGMNPTTQQGINYLRDHADDHLKEGHHKLVSYVPVKPSTPLFIIYYTLWTDENGTLRSWPDVYGYDKAMWEQLRAYMQ